MRQDTTRYSDGTTFESSIFSTQLTACSLFLFLSNKDITSPKCYIVDIEVANGALPLQFGIAAACHGAQPVLDIDDSLRNII